MRAVTETRRREWIRPGVSSAAALVLAEQNYERFTQVRLVQPFEGNLARKKELMMRKAVTSGRLSADDIANAVMAQLLCLESMNPDQDIQIYINSPGGSFTALTAVYDTMRFIKPDIQTVCLGQAASAAAILLAAGTPGKRLALPTSRILIHQPYTEGTFGQTSDIEIQANEILRMRELLERMIADSSGKDIDQVSADIERDKILTAEGAVEYGLIDAVIESRKGAPALA